MDTTLKKKHLFQNHSQHNTCIEIQVSCKVKQCSYIGWINS